MRWHGRRVTVYAYGTPVDMRKSFDGLSALVTQSLQRDVLSGDVFLFLSRDRVRTKVLHWDGTGLCVVRLADNPIDAAAIRDTLRRFFEGQQVELRLEKSGEEEEA